MRYMGSVGTKSVGATILLVERELIIRSEIGEFLRGCGYRVIEVRNADEALIILADDIGKDVSIILTCVDMPGRLDGFGLSQWARQNRPGIKVNLAGSVRRAVLAAENLCRSGPHTKGPYDPQLLAARIRRQ